MQAVIGVDICTSAKAKYKRRDGEKYRLCILKPCRYSSQAKYDVSVVNGGMMCVQTGSASELVLIHVETTCSRLLGFGRMNETQDFLEQARFRRFLFDGRVGADTAPFLGFY